jgi:DNA polymerase III sliding clamp (beta) subunit (PCNA family)
MVVATDGRRLASRAVVASLACTPLIMALIPSKSVKAIRSMQAVGHVLLQVDDRNVYITDQVGNRVIVRQAEGRFPKWRDVVPDDKTPWASPALRPAGDVCASGPDDDRQGVTRRITDD